MKPIIETIDTFSAEKWAKVEAVCEDLPDPAFSLPLACVVTALLAVGIAVAFHRLGWIDVQKLLGPGDPLQVPPALPTAPRVEDHLDVREIENPPQPPEQGNEA
jgi:hypothetical protein